MRFALLLLAGSLASLAASGQPPSLGYGFATFDTDIIICSKNEPGRATEFRRRLDPVRACGRVESKTAAEIRASAPYRKEVQMQLKVFAHNGGSKAQISTYCDSVMANVAEFCATNMGAIGKR